MPRCLRPILQKVYKLAIQILENVELSYKKINLSWAIVTFANLILTASIESLKKQEFS